MSAQTRLSSQEPIDLFTGWPSRRLLPSSSLLTSAQHALTTPSIAHPALLYGPDLGYTPLRHTLARYLTRFYHPTAGAISHDRIIITGGASQNLACVLSAFTDPLFTRRVWMVRPTYYLACRIFEDAGFAGRLMGVEEDAQGIDVDALQRGLEAVDAAEEARELQGRDGDARAGKRAGFKQPPRYPKLFRHIIYCVPTFSNPGGKTMSLARRKALVQLARKHDALIVADDVYDFLRWQAEAGVNDEVLSQEGSIPPRLVDLDRAMPGGSEWGNAISNGSFSKIAGPGARVGWCEGTERLIFKLSEVGATKSGGAPSQMASTFMDDMLTSGALDAHINRTLIPTYRSRYHAMLGAITRYLLPLGVQIDRGVPYEPSSSNLPSSTLPSPKLPSPDASQRPTIEIAGGFFLYILFPAHLPPAAEIAKHAESRYALTIAPGPMFEVWGHEGEGETGQMEALQRSARLCWAWEEEEKLVEGVRRLGEVLKELLAADGQ